MAISTVAIDRLFQRLSATYGAAWDRALGSAPICDVKSVWMHELDGFGDKLHAVAWALDHLPERVPNVLEFRGMCRAAPALILPRLEAPKADPERVRAELAKLKTASDSMLEPTAANHGGAEWAYRIMRKHKAGEKRYAPLTIRMASEVVDRLEGRHVA